MINLQFNFHGIRIFIKNGRRKIDYGDGEYDAGKYYYLNVLESLRSEKPISDILQKSISNLYQITGKTYDGDGFWNAIKLEINKLSDINAQWQIYALLLIIYLAMVDLEESNKYLSEFGKTMVYESCITVLKGEKGYKDAAIMFQKTPDLISTNSNSDDNFQNHNNWDDYGKSGEDYGWYNDYSDDVIDDAFDGHPEATWNID